ncbi:MULTISPECIES: SDR family oxidoreductase [unclassified Acidovorax]|uniref:SDR family oxidoreductase n=1 Tax=unclassified Acidovorax TaxID=2684926 RepID=UPI0028831A5B|nr:MULTISPECIES: SDR family oxidoreductase [unclassified Acidovorax]
MSAAARLLGKVAVVTGAAQGLGRDIAARLVADGADVLLVDRQRQAGEAAARHMGAAATYVEADITDDDQIQAAIDTAMARFGRLDFLVNNACVYADQGLASPREMWLQTLNVNLVSAAMFTHLASAVMGHGSVIVNVGSTGGKFGAAGRALYPASKAGLLQITRNIAVTLAPRGIRCLSVSPAWTWSPAMEAMTGGDQARADAVGARLHPLGRVGRGEDVAAVVAFACSPDAGWITGVDLPVDGGFSALGPDQGRSPRQWLADSE